MILHDHNDDDEIKICDLLANMMAIYYVDGIWIAKKETQEYIDIVYGNT